MVDLTRHSSLLLCAFLPALALPLAAEAPPTLIETVRVFTGDAVLENVDVLIEDGRIAAVGQLTAPAGAAIVDGAGKTLLPGLIDSHVHAFGAALAEALAFGVTTELDMFTDQATAATLRAEQAAGPVPGRADLYSAGTLVTAPGGHGTQFGLPIPTLTRPEDAEAFVAARVAEGSDYIKLIYEDGAAVGRPIPTLDLATLRAAIAAAHHHDKLAVVHVSVLDRAREAVEAGADGLVHVYYDHTDDPRRSELDRAFAELAKESGLFVVPTLTVIESVFGGNGAQSLLEDERIAPYLSPTQASGLRSLFPARGDRTANPDALSAVLERVGILARAGVPILAGTDAPNPGTAHGVSIHRELELLVAAGLSPADALAAATSRPADAFGLADRGRITPGKKADLVLVVGDPTANITATRNISHLWKDGVAFERPTHDSVGGPAAASIAPQKISSFDDGTLAAAVGAWMASTDRIAGGQSAATIDPIAGGALGSAGAIAVSGTLAKGFAFPWAGALWTPGDAPFQPADVSAAGAFSFWARGEGSLRIMVFSESLGQIPAQRDVTLGPEWQRYELELEQFRIDGSDLTGILFSAAALGDFRFELDELVLGRSATPDP